MHGISATRTTTRAAVGSTMTSAYVDSRLESVGAMLLTVRATVRYLLLCAIDIGCTADRVYNRLYFININQIFLNGYICILNLVILYVSKL